jgi:hypothetical protein
LVTILLILAGAGEARAGLWDKAGLAAVQRLAGALNMKSGELVYSFVSNPTMRGQILAKATQLNLRSALPELYESDAATRLLRGTITHALNRPTALQRGFLRDAEVLGIRTPPSHSLSRSLEVDSAWRRNLNLKLYQRALPDAMPPNTLAPSAPGAGQPNAALLPSTSGAPLHLEKLRARTFRSDAIWCGSGGAAAGTTVDLVRRKPLSAEFDLALAGTCMGYKNVRLTPESVAKSNRAFNPELIEQLIKTMK